MTTKFKLGDAVERLNDSHGGLNVGSGGTVVGIKLKDGLNLYSINHPRMHLYPDYWHQEKNLRLVSTGDAVLPPVPDSEVYFNSYPAPGNNQHLRVYTGGDKALGNEVLRLAVIPKVGSTIATRALGIHLDPDSALQLAHDIMRMALKLKREQEKD